VNKLDVEGAADAPIYYLRSVEDARRIREAAARAESVLVIGGGFIGLEAAASLCQRGLEVTLAYPEERVLHRMPGPAIDRFYRGYYESKGIALRPGAKIERFTLDGGKPAAQTDGGESLAADFIVAGIGVSPCVQLAARAGLDVSDGINTDEYLATSASNIYAAGDAASVTSPETGDRLRVEHWQTAHDHGKLAAENMMGAQKPYLDPLYFFSDTFDASWEVWGQPQCAEQAVIIGQPDKGSFSVWWTRHGVVQGAFVMDRPDDEREAAQKAVNERGAVPEELLGSAEIEEVGC
jgi:NADPH-dependent 2,4-dienoyl-CoA reductase/sulfur reductase-like enzyme